MRVTNRLSDLPSDQQALAEKLLADVERMDFDSWTADAEAADSSIDWVPDEYRYQIGGTTYILREPVLEQERQLIRLLREAEVNIGDVEIDLGDLGKTADKLARGVDPLAVLGLIEAISARFFAIILTPEGVSVRDKDLDAIEEHLTWSMRLSQQVRIIQDFFDLGARRIKAVSQKRKRPAKR